MKNENYLVIQGWMVNGLNLKGTELMVFAIIYGFCQGGTGNGCTAGSAYMAEWCGKSQRNVQRALKSLQEKNLITCEEMVVGEPKTWRTTIRAMT